MSDANAGSPGTPGWTGRADQMIAGMRDMGRCYAATHAAMVEGGMTRDEATKVLMAHNAAQQVGMNLKDALKLLRGFE